MYRHTIPHIYVQSFVCQFYPKINPINTPFEPQRDLYVLAVISSAFCLLKLQITHFLYSDVINKVIIENIVLSFLIGREGRKGRVGGGRLFYNTQNTS